MFLLGETIMGLWVVVGEVDVRVEQRANRRRRTARVHGCRKATATILGKRTQVLLRKLRRARSSTGIRAELELTSRRAVRLKHRHLHDAPK